MADVCTCVRPAAAAAVWCVCVVGSVEDNSPLHMYVRISLSEDLGSAAAAPASATMYVQTF